MCYLSARLQVRPEGADGDRSRGGWEGHRVSRSPAEPETSRILSVNPEPDHDIVVSLYCPVSWTEMLDSG